MRRTSIALCALTLLAAVSVSAWAQQLTRTDLMVAARAIGFIQNLPRGTISVGIVYAPGAAQSEQQAQELNALFGDGLRSGNLFLKPIMIPVDQLGRTKPNLYLLTEGVGAGAAQVTRLSRARNVPCITFDLELVRDGTCAMGVRSQPRIQVFVNRSAADASNIEFAAVFRFMITEI